jgi:protein SCO1
MTAMSSRRRLATRLLFVGLVGLLGVATACGADDASVTGTQTTSGETGGALNGLVRPEPLQVGAVTLPDVTDGTPETPFTFRAAPGELLIVYFGFTSCPDVCPTTLADLRVALEQLGPAAERVDLAMVTVDPERDTAAVLSGYLGSFAERYHALRTTDPAALTAAEDAFGASSSVTKADDGEVEVAHSATTYVVDENGTVLVEWPFGLGSAEMAADLQALLDLQEMT